MRPSLRRRRLLQGLLAAPAAGWSGESADPAAALRADLAQFRSEFLARDRAYTPPARALAEQRLARLEAGLDGLSPVALALALAYAVFFIGFARIPLIDRYRRVGDYSYGTYVYAFPIQ